MAEADSRPTHRVCTKCNEEKSLDEFCNAKGGKYGKSARCRDCAAAYAHANQKRINELSLARYYRITADKKAAKDAAKAARLAATEKRCSRCEETKPKSEFRPKKDSQDRLHCYCNLCCNAIGREYRAANPEAAAAWSKKWASKNKDKTEAKRQRWIERNPGRQTELARKWRRANSERVKQTLKEYLESRPDVRLHRSMRQRLRMMLLDKCGKRTFEILGYTRAELVAHLERQFLPGMSWSNYGAWHVDHVLPLSSFQTTSVDDPELRVAWGLPNLRPLWAEENTRKKDKILFLL